MAEHENKDNLEQFFQKNLEGYSPEPSPDFWAKVEPGIPTKPHIWGGWFAAAGQWIGIGLLSGLILTGLFFWQQDRQTVHELSLQVEHQKNEIELLQKKMDEAIEKETKNNLAELNGKIENPKKSNNKKGLVKKETPKSPLIAENYDGTFNISTIKNLSEAIDTQKKLNENFQQKNNSENKLGFNTTEYNSNVISENQNKIKELNLDENIIREKINLLPLLELAELKELPIREHALSTKTLQFDLNQHLSKFSFEVGAGGFVMPLRPLFENDTTISVGNSKLSFISRVLVNLDFNSSWGIRSGFQFKNIRASGISLRYNHFPFHLRKRWAWNTQKQIELYTGLAFSSIINSKQEAELFFVRGLKSSFLSCEAGAAFIQPISHRISVVTQINLGIPITEVVNDNRTISYGLGVALRIRMKK